jgi:adenylyl-sulfate kinase
MNGTIGTDRRGCAIWLTGLPCSGKSTIALRLAELLHARNRRVEVLDGDVVRQRLSQELGFSPEHRHINVLRIGYVAKLLVNQGVVVVTAVVSPYEATRRAVREEIESFFEVHVDCPLEECERRDVKGMYARARSGKLPGFTGVSSPYEAPSSPDVRVNTLELSRDQAVERIVNHVGMRFDL